MRLIALMARMKLPFNMAALRKERRSRGQELSALMLNYSPALSRSWTQNEIIFSIVTQIFWNIDTILISETWVLRLLLYIDRLQLCSCISSEYQSYLVLCDQALKCQTQVCVCGLSECAPAELRQEYEWAIYKCQGLITQYWAYEQRFQDSART